MSFGRNDFDLGGGDNSVSLGLNIGGVDIKAEDGNDYIGLWQNSYQEEAYASILQFTHAKNIIDVGNGSNNISIGVNIAGTDVKAGNGDDHLSLGGVNGIGHDNADLSAFNFGSNHIDLGDGNNDVWLYDYCHSYVQTVSGDDRINVIMPDDGVYALARGTLSYDPDGIEGAGSAAYEGVSNYIDTGAGNDDVQLYMGANTVYTRDGDDQIGLSEFTSDSVIYTGNGNDMVYMNSYDSSDISNNVIYTGNGNDVVNIGGAYNNIYTEADDDLIELNNYSHHNNVYAGDGNDKITINAILVVMAMIIMPLACMMHMLQRMLSIITIQTVGWIF